MYFTYTTYTIYTTYCNPKYFSNLTVIAIIPTGKNTLVELYIFDSSLCYTQAQRKCLKFRQLLLKILLIWAKRYNIFSAKIFGFTVHILHLLHILRIPHILRTPHILHILRTSHIQRIPHILRTPRILRIPHTVNVVIIAA